MNFSGKYIFRIIRLCGFGLLLAGLHVIAFDSCFASQSETPSIMMPLAAKSLVLDLANSGQRIVAVGYRGHILISEDDAKSWHQVAAPTREMLTGVYFKDNLRGWAVGHGAVILATEDGGKSWKLLSAAPEEERPLFDVIVTGDYGFAVGAYAKFMTTQDGGKNWEAGELVIEKSAEALEEALKDSPDDEEPLPFDYHFNAIARSAAGVFYIAAEAGYLFRSDDGGHTWKELPSPYGGSFFGILPLDGEALLAYGLRGNIFRSADKGQSWVQITTGTTALLTDAARLPDGTIVITGMAGVVLFSSDTGKSFTLLQPNRISLTSVVNTVSNTLVVAGERGPQIYNLPESTK